MTLSASYKARYGSDNKLKDQTLASSGARLLVGTNTSISLRTPLYN